MNYVKDKDKIIITNLEDFNIVQILDCGQIFRYNIDDNIAKVFSIDKMATITTYKDKVIIESEQIDYFEHFFDLNTDYGKIKFILKDDLFLKDAIKFGYGIRILKNDLFEMIVSFIISANNNISRIKKSIDYLCTHFGTRMNGYYAFPRLEELKIATVQDYIDAGLGYRATYMYDTIQCLTYEILNNIKEMNPQQQKDFLVSLKGIGDKVANCIMLFGLGVMSSFPVDTWINKVYNVIMKTNSTDRKKIQIEMTNRYGGLSGYAQQYFFYYFRENNIK